MIWKTEIVKVTVFVQYWRKCDFYKRNKFTLACFSNENVPNQLAVILHRAHVIIKNFRSETVTESFPNKRSSTERACSTVREFQLDSQSRDNTCRRLVLSDLTWDLNCRKWIDTQLLPLIRVVLLFLKFDLLDLVM